MKRTIISLGIVILILSLSCIEKGKVKNQASKYHRSLETDFSKWWGYHYDSIHLAMPFISIDTNGNQMTKKDFLSELNSGDFIPIKLKEKNNIQKYQLFELTNNADSEIRKTIKNISKKVLTQYDFIGKEFPEFSFKDLTGRIYTNDSIKGKIVVLKCWFISCKPCIKEFPLLNEYVLNHNREDVLFMSLALDNEKDLKEFLDKKKLEYATVPDQKEFMEVKLKVEDYPTHIIIDRDGLFTHISNKAEEMIQVLENNLSAETKELPPPPPPM